jgi:hypothetical protein
MPEVFPILMILIVFMRVSIGLLCIYIIICLYDYIPIEGIYNISKNLYDFVINKIDYSQVKRFGVNERQGALATLRNGSGVCMEYSDLFLTLSRAQGIPAKAVFGYGFDPMISNTNQEAHQWVQVLIPGSGKWLDLDVTWGESGDAAVGGYLNHFYTHIASVAPDQNSEVIVTGLAIKDNKLELPKYDITAKESMPTTGKYQTSAELITKYPMTSKSQVVDILIKIPALKRIRKFRKVLIDPESLIDIQRIERFFTQY